MKRRLWIMLFLVMAAPAAASVQVCGPNGCAQSPLMPSAFVGVSRNTNATRATDENCVCSRHVVDQDMAAWDAFEYSVSTLDADDTVNFAIFSLNGATKLFACALNVTSTGGKSCTNTLTTGAHARGSYWFCTGTNVVTTEDWQIAAGSASSQYFVNITGTCTAGAIPATMTPNTTPTNNVGVISGYLVDS